MPESSLPRPTVLRSLLLGLGALLLLAFGLTLYSYFAGDDHTLPVTVARVPAGSDTLALQANGYLVTQTRDVAGPLPWPDAAAVWAGLLGLGLTVWLAVVSQLARPAFIAGTAAVIFLLMSLNVDLLGVFGDQHQYFLILSLSALGGTAFLLHAFFERVALGWRLLLFGVLVGGLAALLFIKAPHPAEVILLHLAAYGTMPGAAAVALLTAWLGGELIYGLLWLNTQGATPRGRFGLLPFVLSSALLLGILALYYWNGSQLEVLPSVHLDPFFLLLLAALIGWRTLPLRQPTYRTWLPLTGAGPLYLVVVLVVVASVGYAFATANEPLLQAERSFIGLALGALSFAFFVYILLNFEPLIRQRLQVHRVAYDPRRVPFFAVYVLGLGIVGLLQLRNRFELLDRARAGQYIQLGDLTRLQSELQPGNLYLALLAERYYAEADQLDPRNARAALGRAALYQARSQRQNEINILRIALRREPNDKVLLRLAARFDQPADFFDRQQILRQALKAYPTSPLFNAEMAQLYTRSALTDSVQYYFRRAITADDADPLPYTNWLAFLLKNQQLTAAQQSASEAAYPEWPAWQNNVAVLNLLQRKFSAVATGKVTIDTALTAPQFAQLYHVGLAQTALRDTASLPLTRNLLRVPANDAYADQLSFLQGLQLLRSPRPAPGFDQLEALASGATSGYYHHVLGLYLLERGLYASAAARLAEAEAAGDAGAALPRAYAFAWAGHPDSARTAAERAIRNNPASVTQLRSVLQGVAPRPAAPLRPLAAQFQQVAQRQDSTAAQQYRRLVQADPFDEMGVMQAGAYFTSRQDPVTGYEILRRALSYNPESVPLLKEFALTAVDAGLEDYSINSLNKLYLLLPSAESSTFRNLYDKRRAAHQAAVAPWN